MEGYSSQTIKLLFKLLLIPFITFLLASCSDDSESDYAWRDANVTASLAGPTGQNLNVEGEEEASDEVEEEKRVEYTRAEDYPKVKKLPLKFIDTESGKDLAVSVTLPADENGEVAEGPFPTILVQTGYNMSLLRYVDSVVQFVDEQIIAGAQAGAADPYLVKRGYAMVSVDVYGTGLSEGGWDLFGEKEQVGYGEAVDWIISQDWSDGTIGTSGASYMAISALFTAQIRPDNVRAVFALVPMGDAQRGTVGTGGMLNGVFMSFWMRLTQNLGVFSMPTIIQYPQLFSRIRRTTNEHATYVDSFYLPLIDDALNGEDYLAYNSDFWRTRSPLENIDKITAPTFVIGSLHDIFQRDQPLLYERFIANGLDSRLLIYDEDHATSAAMSFAGSDSVPQLHELLLQWFDKHLKGIDSGVEEIPPVTQYVKNHEGEGEDGFVTSNQWPHPDLTPERWYLHGDYSLTRVAPDQQEPTNSMAAAEPADIVVGTSDDGRYLEFEVTPKDGSECSISYRQWTLGGARFLSDSECLYDNKLVERNALNYDSEPMPEDYYINGPIQADIWLESNVTEAVLSVRIDEVSPNGLEVLPISNGLLAASVRAVDESKSRYIKGEMIQPHHYLTKEEAQPVVPGEVFKMQVEIFPTSAIIREGHSLRVSIAPSNQAQGIMNNIQKENSAGGITTIHNSPDYPSSIIVPTVPLSSLN